MKRFYSQSTGSTYLLGLHKSMPQDAVEISDARFQSVIASPVAGKVRGHDAEGLPILIDPPPPPPPTREQVEALRLRAYAEPQTGSDRYFAEAQRMQVMGEDGWEGVRAAGVARFEAIQSLYPWSPPDPDVTEPQ